MTAWILGFLFFVAIVAIWLLIAKRGAATPKRRASQQGTVTATAAGDGGEPHRAGSDRHGRDPDRHDSHDADGGGADGGGDGGGGGD
jgi:hypothetical protein